MGAGTWRAGHFILGVECDGKNYHSAKTARDRDRLRESVLEGLGWRLHRIWSTDWFYNREAAQGKLLDTVNNAIVQWRNTRKTESIQISTIMQNYDSENPNSIISTNASGTADTNDVATDDAILDAEVYEKSIADTDSIITECLDTPTVGQQIAEHMGLDAIPIYMPMVFSGNLKNPAPFFSKGTDTQIRDFLRKVIDVESPVAVDVALLRVAGFWGQTILTPAVRQHMTPAMRGLLQKRHHQMAFFWKSDKDLSTYRGFRRNGSERDSQRTPDNIPPEEYANAVEWLIKGNGVLPKSEVMRLLGDVFLFSYVALTDCPMLDIGFELLINQSRVIVNSEGVFTYHKQQAAHVMPEWRSP